MKTAIIDVGGGMRGIYAEGVLDYCMDEDIHFDVAIGISAGSANLASFLAGQRKRNYTFYTEYSKRRDYVSFHNFISKGSYIDLNYVYSTLSNSGGEYPLDYDHMMADPTEFVVVASDAITGNPRYFTKRNIHRDGYDIFKASSAIPYVCKPISLDGHLYYDGAISDPVPVRHAFDMGCDKVVLLLTRPKDYIRNSKKDDILARLIYKKYPNAAGHMHNRAARYNKEVAFAKKYEERGHVLIIAPDDTCGVDTLSVKSEQLDNFYQKGYKDACAIRSFIQK